MTKITKVKLPSTRITHESEYFMGRHRNTMYPKIFVKIPALDDSELTHTIENAIQSAAYPERLVFSIWLVCFTRDVGRRKGVTVLESSACNGRPTVGTEM